VRVRGAAVAIFLFLAQTAVAGAQTSTLADRYKSAESELRAGDLDAAQRDFAVVIKAAPQDPGAHANLGVIHMRRHEWAAALEQLRKAAALAPGVAGVRLNIGLVEFHTGSYPAALESFESVLHDDTSSLQARYLLGLCQFFLQRYPEARNTLAPLQDSQSDNLQYLYVFGIAAGRSGDATGEKAALARLLAIGKDTPEMHLWAGKAYFARGDDAGAARELRLALQGDPKLAFAHYYLGRIARNQQQLDEARAEFLADQAISPDTPFDAEQLGELSAAAGDTHAAERYYVDALKLQPQLITARYGLAKTLRAEGRFTEALNEVDRAAQIDGQSQSLHYLRGQLLQKLGRSDQARKEFAICNELRQKVQDDLERKIGGSAGVDSAMLTPSM
jgi:tetratricopeptide (TPR) repeat protein